MGKVTIFTTASCPFCKRAKELLAKKNVSFEEINVSENPEWRPLLFLLTNGGRTVPKIFFNEKFIGGSSDLQALEEKGVLDGMLKETLERPTPDFPPPLRKPQSQECLQVRVQLSSFTWSSLLLFFYFNILPLIRYCQRVLLKNGRVRWTPSTRHWVEHRLTPFPVYS